MLNTTIDTNKDSHSKTSNENEILKDKNENLVKEVQKWESWKKSLEEKYKSKSDMLDSTLTRVDANEEKKNIREKEQQQKRIKIDLRTWQDWEATVENKIRLICDENILKYISQEDYPSEKKPDNSIEIANQFIIFDAKSPKSHDKLDSFKKTIAKAVNEMDKYSGDKTLNVSKDMSWFYLQLRLSSLMQSITKGIIPFI